MIKNWTFGIRLAAGFGVAGLVLLIVSVVGYRSTGALIDNEDWLTHSHVVRGELADLLSEMKDAETGQRGYVITGNDDYLTPYRQALAQVKTTYESVRGGTADNPNQQRRLAALPALIDAKFAELKQTIDLRRTEGFEAAYKVVSNNSGKATMDQIRTIIGDADHEEQELLTQRNAEAKSGADWTKRIILWGGLLGVAAVAAIGWYITATLSEQVGGAVGQVRSSSAELQAAAGQQATGARQQATAMSEITTTISELMATSRQIADSAQRVAQIAGQTTDMARSGHMTVDETQESMGGIRRQVDQIVSHMLELGRKSQEIGAVLDIVAELAEQTNILAINATIEAAGAGDQGKRFAVVADEIRKLADRVGGSTKEIRRLIDDVRSAVNTTVMATETGSKAVDGGSRQFGDVAAGFKQIAGLLATTMEAAREIELSTKQQASAVEQVNVAITNIAQASKENEASSTQTQQTATQLAGLARQLSAIVRAERAV